MGREIVDLGMEPLYTTLGVINWGLGITTYSHPFITSAGISAPTFQTPSIRGNQNLQYHNRP